MNYFDSPLDTPTNPITSMSHLSITFRYLKLRITLLTAMLPCLLLPGSLGANAKYKNKENKTIGDKSLSSNCADS